MKYATHLDRTLDLGLNRGKRRAVFTKSTGQFGRAARGPAGWATRATRWVALRLPWLGRSRRALGRPKVAVAGPLAPRARPALCRPTWADWYPRRWADLVPSAAGLHRGLVCHGRLGLVRPMGRFPFLLSLLFCLKWLKFVNQ